MGTPDSSSADAAPAPATGLAPRRSLARSPLLLVALICAIYASACLVHVTSPFLRHQESVIARYASFARNFARLGCLETRFTMLLVNCPDMTVFGDWQEHLYPQRPPISAIALSLWVRVLGDAEWVIRVNLIVVGIATIVAFYLVAVKLLDGRWALLGTAVFALNPMFLYFSIIAAHYAYGLLLSLLAWGAALRVQEGRRYVVAMFCFLVLGCFTDWPAYFGVLSLALYFWKGWRSGISYALCGAAVTCFALILLHRWWLDPVTGRFLRRLLQVGVHHAQVGGLSPVRYVYSEVRELGLYFTVGISIAAAVGTTVLLRRRTWPPLLFGLFGLEELLFPRQAYEHDYLTFVLAPFMALTATVGFQTLWAARRARPVAIALALAACVQSGWVAGNRLTRMGGNEPGWQSAVAIRSHTLPRNRVLLAMDNSLVDYYSDRYVAVLDGITKSLSLSPKGPVPIRGMDDLLGYLEKPDSGFDVVVVGAAEAALGAVSFFRANGIGYDELEKFWFYREDHPLRRLLRSRAAREESHGAYVFYWLRPPG